MISKGYLEAVGLKPLNQNINRRDKAGVFLVRGF